MEGLKPLIKSGGFSVVDRFGVMTPFCRTGEGLVVASHLLLAGAVAALRKLPNHIRRRFGCGITPAPCRRRCRPAGAPRAPAPPPPPPLPRARPPPRASGAPAPAPAPLARPACAQRPPAAAPRNSIRTSGDKGVSSRISTQLENKQTGLLSTKKPRPCRFIRRVRIITR
eukprot:1194847-Prorocentrum_minimum.AAC.6